MSLGQRRTGQQPARQPQARTVTARQVDQQCTTITIKEPFNANDVIITSISLTTVSPYYVGDTLQGSFTVENANADAASFDWAVTVGGTQIDSGTGTASGSLGTNSVDFSGPLPSINGAEQSVDVCAILQSASKA